MVAALILIPAENLDLPKELKEQFRARWTSWWLPFRDQVRQSPPVEETEEERFVLSQFLVGLADVLSEFGPQLLPHLRSGFDRLLQDLVAAEEANAPVERRLGFRYLGRAVQVLDTFFEAYRAFGLADANAFSAPPSEDVSTRMTSADAAILRLELAVFIAFDLIKETEGSTSEFVGWARRAQNASNYASPYVSLLSPRNPRASAPSETWSSDVVVTDQSYDEILRLSDDPPSPSNRLRELLRGRDS